MKAASEASGLWGTSWAGFAPLCVAQIKKDTGEDVSEESLRRSILPVGKFPRPE